MKHLVLLLGVALVGINVSSALAQYQPRQHANRTLGYSAHASPKPTLHFQPIPARIPAPGGRVDARGSSLRADIPPQPVPARIPAPGAGSSLPHGPAGGAYGFGGAQPGPIPGPGRLNIGGAQPDPIPGPGRVDRGQGAYGVAPGSPDPIPGPGHVDRGQGAYGVAPGSPTPIPGPVAQASAICLTSAGVCGRAPQWAGDKCWCTGPLGEQYLGVAGWLLAR
jgi:hypothetical protein